MKYLFVNFVHYIYHFNCFLNLSVIFFLDETFKSFPNGEKKDISMFLIFRAFKKKDSRKVAFNGGCIGTEIDFVLMKKRQRKFLMNVKVIGGELQHKLPKVVLDRRWLKNARSSCAKKE